MCLFFREYQIIPTMERNYNEQLTALREQIDFWQEIGVGAAKRLAGILSLIQDELRKLRQDVIEHPFADTGEEIEFFKRVKPAFVAEQIYAVERFSLDSSRPLGDELALKAYYEFELKHIRRFFDTHRFLYQYYLLDGHELDHLYFVRGAATPVLLKADLPDADPEFSTAADYLYAKFLAYERLQEYLAGLLYPAANNLAENKGFSRWPGDKNELIELGYGIFCWLKARGSKVSIAEIMQWLEDSFGMKLGRHYRSFAEIKMRKVASRTKFFDEVLELLVQYMDEGDAWKPGAN